MEPRFKYCSSCGQKIAEAAAFCERCGGAVSRSAAAAPIAAPVAPVVHVTLPPAPDRQRGLSAFTSTAIFLFIVFLGFLLYRQHEQLEQSRRPLGALANLADDAGHHGTANALRGMDNHLHPSGFELPQTARIETPAPQSTAPQAAPGQRRFDSPQALGIERPNSGLNSRVILQKSFQVPARAMRTRQINTPEGADQILLIGNFSAVGGSGNDIRVMVWATDAPGVALYDSGKVTSGGMNVNLQPRTSYILAFDNRFSLSSPKIVTADVSLTFDQP